MLESTLPNNGLILKAPYYNGFNSSGCFGAGAARIRGCKQDTLPGPYKRLVRVGRMLCAQQQLGWNIKQRNPITTITKTAGIAK